jgi:hypothetical protein
MPGKVFIVSLTLAIACLYVQVGGPLTVATLVSRNTCLLVFFAPPDDESSAPGLIQRVLSTGGAVKVVFMTSGDGFLLGSQWHVIRYPTA